MDTWTEGLAGSDVDTEMTALTQEDITEQNLDASDEVEHLRNSLREAVHDDSVRPKMQCLMMDSSFSMVTMQGEDSGIAWETTPSRCTTPWASEAGNPTMDLSSLIAVRPATPGSVPAGKIIFVMDEGAISRRKKTKERVSSQRSKADRQREVLTQSSENIHGRPELIGFSQPNVKTEEGDEEELSDPLVDKDQRLFSLVSEGSEILNIVVPPKVATVDEEESKEMVDNLSYLEDSPVSKANEDIHDYELMVISATAPGGARGDQARPSTSNIMDPPGAPVARPLGRGAAGNVDYFEPFTLIDAQAPGSPAVIAQGQMEPEVGTESQDTDKPVQPKDNTTTTTRVDNDKSDTVSLEEITSELLDEVFYGGADNYPKNLDREAGVAESAHCRLPSKPSGSTLFGSQEDILTPIFLPEGPPKIIDPILLEEPKAMAFLYTDLYEEAIGSRKKEEDTESMTSEKSFHSRHSDREARGYLEKYVLIDETPSIEVEPSDKGKCPQEGPRVLSQDLYDFGDLLSKHEKGEMPNSEEEITDFFRSSDNSSPCDIEPFARSLEEDDAQSASKSKVKRKKNVAIREEKVTEIPTDPLSISSFEFLSEEPEWGSTDDHPIALDKSHEHTGQELWKQDPEVQRPVAPPRKKAKSPPKACLDLTPLTPVEVIMQEKEEAGGKEQREEEKETASPAETADEGFGDLAALPVEVDERRPTCLRCRRPQKVCLCPFLPPQPLEVSTCLYIVQHPAEESRVLRTVPLLAACLPQGKCNVIVGRRFNEEKHPELAAVCRDSRTLILYPGPKSQNLEELVQYQEVGTVEHNVIIIDGTWSQAKNMFLKNSLLHLPKQVQLNRSLSSQYVIRTQPSNICLSTLECAAVALSILEQNDHIQEVLLRPLRALCSFQLQHGAQIHHSKEHLLKNGMYDKPMPKNKRKIKRMEKLVSDHNICPR
uniref:cardiomyopathy-associated protein 5-like n=1 Tax=Scatophagus argus TaxID=75038 RepID=UPI001ED7E523|nr:cardiomyopathy-associated protein 5-like [Scatophagus argus]